MARSEVRRCLMSRDENSASPPAWPRAGWWSVGGTCSGRLCSSNRPGGRVCRRILARIVAPTFPSRDFDITRFGAKGDGVTDCTAALRDAIAACANAGGGRVVVPSGQFVTGAIRLQSRVNLHLADEAVLRFSQAPRDFLPMVLTRFEGVELINYSPFIYALDARDIAVTGRGTLDGRADADHWWPWKSADARPIATRLGCRAGRAGRAGGRAPLRRRPFPPAEFHSTVSLHERAHRGRHDRQLADVGDPSRSSRRTSRFAG